MQYLLLIYENEAYWETLSEKEQGQVMQEYMDFTEDRVSCILQPFVDPARIYCHAKSAP